MGQGRGGGSKIGQKSVTYYLNGPLCPFKLKNSNISHKYFFSFVSQTCGRGCGFCFSDLSGLSIRIFTRYLCLSHTTLKYSKIRELLINCYLVPENSFLMVMQVLSTFPQLRKVFFKPGTKYPSEMFFFKYN